MAHRTPKRRTELAGIVLSLIAVAPTLAAEPESTTIAELVEQLQAPELSRREAASAELTERSDELASAVGGEINAAELSAEQGSRLMEILRQRFILSPRAGLGVQFSEPPADGLTRGVSIQAVVPGFPAADILMPGDLVVRAEGQPLVGQPRAQAEASFRYAILSLNPGEFIHLEVIRAGDTLNLQIPMGSFTDLANGMQPDARWLEGAWRIRAKRIGLEPGHIQRLELEDVQRWVAAYKPRLDVPGMLPAGRPRALPDAERSVGTLAKIDATARSVTKQQLAAAAQLRELETRLVELRSKIRETRNQAAALNPRGQDFQRLQLDISRYEREMQIIERQRKETIGRVGALSGVNR